jgi:hypothetical protein
MQVKDRGKSLNVVIIGSPNVNPGYQLVANQDYPEIAADYAKTFRLLKSLPCDIFLGAHGNYYGMEAKYRSGNPAGFRLAGECGSNPTPIFSTSAGPTADTGGTKTRTSY